MPNPAGELRFRWVLASASLRPVTKGKQPLYLCMGSACHQRGGFRLLPQLEALIAQHGLQECVELKGAFCLDHCLQGRSLRFEDRILIDVSPENLEARFVTEILPHVRHA